jgi:ATP-binding cassette subfamily B protein
MYDVDSGSISIDGVNVKDYSFDSLRRSIGIVLQDTYLFSGTVASNIAYAKPGATMDEIISAAKDACAHNFIMNLPDGYDTYIGGGGQSLSGGERQRLALARAILMNPKILVLDEATSAVDTKTEMEIQSAMEKFSKGRTTFNIAHRLSTLRNADRLIVIEGGKIVETGTHWELSKIENGVYKRLYDIQKEALKVRGLKEEDGN